MLSLKTRRANVHAAHDYYVIHAFSHVELITNQATDKLQKERLCERTAADRWTRPLTLLSLIKCIRTF